MERNLSEIVRKMTLEEKASLCSGKDFWYTKDVKRAGVPSIMMTDGPHGLRKQAGDPDGLGLLGTPATCFPAGCALAASWDRELIEEVGRTIAAEAQAENVAIVLGPAVNIKRSPLCGRNFEYLSEDPLLTGELAAHHIRGLQSEQVGASIKHFAANNQERLRMTIDAVVDERTLREIYLAGFEIAVKASQPWTVMCAYNRLNGEYCAENRWLLTTVLKEEWGHTGIVVTDWGACNDRVAGLEAGQELEMPGNGGLNDREIVRAVESGSLDVAVLDRAVERILDVTFRGVDGAREGATADLAAHHRTARMAGTECMVLLKNDGPILPLAKRGKVAFVGEFARTPRYQGGGSSHITPSRMDSAVEEAQKVVGHDAEILFASGYSLKSSAPDQKLVAEAAKIAADADVAVVFIGLTDAFESEGFDREHMRIPENHTALLEAVLAVQENVVVVLSNGSPIEMPWVDRPKAILESYLGGQAWGGAVADVLFGEANPSGKLPETFPLRLEDNPSYLSFPGDGRTVEYREGVFVGYRYYDKKAIRPLFPFGHGLSYTRFSYADLTLGTRTIRDTDELSVSVRITNDGNVAGKEVVQLYVADAQSSVPRPVRELKGFQKVSLDAGESTVIHFTLTRRSFAYWSRNDGDWVVESGEFRIDVGASSRDIRLTDTVQVESSTRRATHFHLNSTVRDLEEHPVGKAIAEQFQSGFLASLNNADPDSTEALMFRAMVQEMPLRNIVRMGSGQVTPEAMDRILEQLNAT